MRTVVLWILSVVACLGSDASCVAGLKAPVYAPLAVQARIEGLITARFQVDSTGHPAEVAVEGHPLLTPGVSASLSASVLDAAECGGRRLTAVFRFQLSDPSAEEPVSRSFVSFEEPNTFTILTVPPRYEAIACPGPDPVTLWRRMRFKVKRWLS
jgi:hypothetical protein